MASVLIVFRGVFTTASCIIGAAFGSQVDAIGIATEIEHILILCCLVVTEENFVDQCIVNLSHIDTRSMAGIIVRYKEQAG